MIVKEAMAWLNTPYRHNQRCKGAGVDCGQFIIGVFEGAGLVPVGDITTTHYSHDWYLHQDKDWYLAWIEKYCDKITDEPQPGDVALYRFGRCVSHGAIVVEWPTIIHAAVGRGVILSDNDEGMLFDKKGQSRLVGIYRFRR